MTSRVIRAGAVAMALPCALAAAAPAMAGVTPTGGPATGSPLTTMTVTFPATITLGGAAGCKAFLLDDVGAAAPDAVDPDISATIAASAVTCTNVVKTGSTQSLQFALPAANPGWTSPKTVSVRVTDKTGAQAATLSSSFTYYSAPTLLTAFPLVGAEAGGTGLTLTGAGFLSPAVGGVTGVIVGGTPAASPVVVSDTQVTARAPALSPLLGPYDVTVRAVGGDATLTGVYSVIAAPGLAALSDSAGSIFGGGTVTLTGSGFATATAVKFGATSATFSAASDTQIVATIPQGSAGGSVDVRVLGPGGQSPALPYTYVLPPAPVITGVSPGQSPLAGGTTVTITGTELRGASSVTFGGTAATNYTVVSPTKIEATTPPRAAGTATLRLVTPGGIDAVPFSYSATATATAAATLRVTKRTRITGSARLGARLTCTPATFNAAVTRTVWWQRSGNRIRGAKGLTYRLRSLDRGRRIACVTRGASASRGIALSTSPTVRVR